MVKGGRRERIEKEGMVKGGRRERIEKEGMVKGGRRERIEKGSRERIEIERKETKGN